MAALLALLAGCTVLVRGKRASVSGCTFAALAIVGWIALALFEGRDYPGADIRPDFVCFPLPPLGLSVVAAILLLKRRGSIGETEVADSRACPACGREVGQAAYCPFCSRPVVGRPD
jgi:hypothetical protein